MKYWAEFYHLDPTTNGYREVCGDRGILRLDGRSRMHTHKLVAIDWAIKHKFDGFRICRGELRNLFYINAAVIPVTSEGTTAPSSETDICTSQSSRSSLCSWSVW